MKANLPQMIMVNDVWNTSYLLMKNKTFQSHLGSDQKDKTMSYQISADERKALLNFDQPSLLLGLRPNEKSLVRNKLENCRLRRRE